MTNARDVGRRKYLWFGAIVIAVLLLVPFPTRLAPEFTVRFVDGSGDPVGGMKVRQSCTHYTYESVHNTCEKAWDNPGVTDADGKIHFERRDVWFGAASRVVRATLSYVLLIAHGSVGRDVTLFTNGNDSGLASYVVSIDPDNPPEEIILTDEAVNRHNMEVSSQR